MPSTRFQPLHPRNSLRKLRTAFTTSSSPTAEDPRSPMHSPSFSSISPLSAGTATSRLSGFSFGNMSTLSIGSAFHSRRLIRRKKSMVEIEQEDERSLVGDDILSVVEPRPRVGAAYGGIEEILAGRA